jgi:hypothetical protein
MARKAIVKGRMCELLSKVQGLGGDVQRERVPGQSVTKIQREKRATYRRLIWPFINETAMPTGQVTMQDTALPMRLRC